MYVALILSVLILAVPIFLSILFNRVRSALVEEKDNPSDAARARQQLLVYGDGRTFKIDGEGKTAHSRQISGATDYENKSSTYAGPRDWHS